MTRGIRAGCGVLIWLGTVVLGPAAELPPDAPVQEPPVTVRGEVPILKVGEYQMLSRRFAPAAVAYQDALYIFGGTDGDRPVAEIERFDLKTHKARVAHTMVYAAHYIFLFGDYATPDELVTYDLLTRKSETFPRAMLGGLP